MIKERQSEDVVVTLVECKKCKHGWTQENMWNKAWCCSRCDKCGGEGSTVTLGKIGDYYENLHTDAGVMMIWDEE